MAKIILFGLIAAAAEVLGGTLIVLRKEWPKKIQEYLIAILLHKLPEGLTIASIMIAASQPRKNAFLASLAIGVATMLGIVIVFLISGVEKSTVGIAFAFSAGAATYVGASDLIPEVNRSKNRVVPLIVFAGMLL